MKAKIKSLLSVSLLELFYRSKKNQEIRRRQKKQKDLIEVYLKNHDLRKLQIGCGSNILHGWLNTDINTEEGIAYLDAGKEFPFPDESINYVFSEHIFEHLTFPQQKNMLEESLRVLKKGGVLRITTPTLDFLFDLYHNNSEKVGCTYTNWAIQSIPKLEEIKMEVLDHSTHHIYVINNFFKAWGHQVIHNYKSLKSLGQQVGFKIIKELEIGESEEPSLCRIEKHGTIIPEDINNYESMVVEMKKE